MVGGAGYTTRGAGMVTKGVTLLLHAARQKVAACLILRNNPLPGALSPRALYGNRKLRPRHFAMGLHTLCFRPSPPQVTRIASPSNRGSRRTQVSWG